MAGITNDQLSSSQQRELTNLQAKSRSSGLKIYLWIFSILIISFVFSAVYSLTKDKNSIEDSRQELLSSDYVWAENLSRDQEKYLLWFERYGISLERSTFNLFSEIIFSSATTFANLGRKISASTEAFFTSLHFGFLRVAFLILASWRLWVVVVLLFGWSKRGKYQLYKGNDILGELGNGRVFFSGLLCSFGKLLPNGAPDKQIRGLACPPAVSEVEAKSSNLAKILAKYAAANKANTSLAAIIIKHQNYPLFVGLYVGAAEEQVALNKFFSGASLLTGSEKILQAILEVQKILQNAKNIPNDATFSQKNIFSETPQQLHEYVANLAKSIIRVLTSSQKKALIEIRVEVLACLVLTMQTGKVLSYKFEAGKWLKKSSFPQLAARAVMHSIPTFAKEFSFAERMDLRRAIIYSARHSPLSTVQFPVDLSLESRALRQISELLLALPHEMQIVADQVELHGIIVELHNSWTKKITESVQNSDTEFLNDSFVSQTDMLFMPLQKIVRIFDGLVDKNIFHRLEQLLKIVSQKQRLEAMSRELVDGGDKLPVINAMRILPPFSRAEFEKIALAHEIKPQVLRRWAVYRAILNAFGWLGRRVGDYSISDAAVIFLVGKPISSNLETNQAGLIGKSGIVALRSSKLEEKQGKFWQARFAQISSAKMAENKENYTKLLKGEEIDLIPVNDEQAAGEDSLGNLEKELKQIK